MNGVVANACVFETAAWTGVFHVMLREGTCEFYRTHRGRCSPFPLINVKEVWPEMGPKGSIFVGGETPAETTKIETSRKFMRLRYY